MNKLVVYFTYTGNTKSIAELIKEKLNCDILEIKPKIEYSSDYQTVVDDHENNLQIRKTPEIEDINIDLTNYDEIILGTPVWWYTIAPPIRTFLTKYDLSGKVIYPFATNAGWLGSTFTEIKELCPNSKVVEEENIIFESYSSNLVTNKEEINDWINKIKES